MLSVRALANRQWRARMLKSVAYCYAREKRVVYIA